MNNKILMFLAKAVGTVVLFFIVDLIFEYLVAGIVDYTKSVRFALIYGVVLVVVREIYYYFKKKKQ